MNRFTCLVLVGMTASLMSMASAQPAPWPTKPIRLVVPASAGGVTDIRARWLADRLGPVLGQSIVVDPKPGAGGNLATEQVARSAPDGYTLLIVHLGTMAINPHMYSRPGFDALKDFAPIARLGAGPLVLTVNSAVPATSVAELVALAKAKPGQLNFASPGTGTPPHLAAELFKRLAGFQATHVPYKGGGQAVSDLIAGHVSFYVESLNVQLPHVQAGRLRALAVTGKQRLAALPQVPTFDEAGVSGYEFLSWVGIVAPAATPAAIVAKLNREISTILGTSEAREWFGAAGTVPGAMTADEFSALIRSEHARWGPIVRDAGLKAE